MKKDPLDVIESYKEYEEEVMLWYLYLLTLILANDVFYRNSKFEYPTNSFLAFLKYTFSLYRSTNIGYIILATLFLPFRLICCVLAPLLPILGLAIETIVVPLAVYIIFKIAYLPEKFLDKKNKSDYKM